MDHFLLVDLIPVEILQETQDAFSRFTGMAALITDANGTPVTEGSGFTRFCMELNRKSELGCRNCEACDRQGAIMTLQTGNPAVYHCHAGLIDYAAPIMLNGDFIGSFIGGQVRTEPVDERIFRSRAKLYGLDPDEYIKEAKAANEVPEEQIHKAAQFLTELASVLSKLAYQRFLVLEQKQALERSSKSQTNIIQRFSEELTRNFSELTDFLMDLDEKMIGDDAESISKYTYAVTLANNTKLLGTMLEDSLDYMSIEDGSFELKESIYDIRQVVGLKIKEFVPRGQEKNNTIEWSVDRDVPEQMVGDPVRIGGIIGKLVENSIRYSDNNTIRVDIKSRQLAYSTMLEIKVSDSGVGMAQKDARRIREYMMSRGTSDTEDKEYNNLGFALIGYSVNAMSGRIDIASKLGKGTTFTVTVPQLAVR